MSRTKLHFSPSIKDDPVEFTQKFLINADGSPAQPHITQQEFLRNIKPLSVACCGRQWGKSVGLGWYGSWFSVTHAHREIYVIAPTLDQARIIFNEIAHQFRGPLASLVVGKIVEFPFPKIELANGTRIHARGANSPQYIRGKPGHLFIVDEAAFVKDGTIPKVIEPMLTVTGRQLHSGLILISTPFGLGDFHEYFQKAGSSDKSSHFHYSSLDNPHADRDRLEDIKNTYGEDSLIWRTEYLAEFVDDDLSVFSSKDIKWAYEHYPYEMFPVAPESGHRYVSGVDLANVRDFFVASILDVSNPSLVPLVKLDRYQKKGYTFYKNLVRQNYQTYRPRTLIDATSLGESVAEDLRDVNVEGYKFTNQSKYEIVHELARLLAEHRLTIPYNREIIDELRFFSYKYTANKVLRMEALGNKHDDIVMSLALAAHLACIPTNTGFFVPLDLIPRPQKVSDDIDPWKELFTFD